MTENGDPLENVIAERVNGIIKEEYLDDYKVDNIKEVKKVTKVHTHSLTVFSPRFNVLSLLHLCSVF